MRHHRESVYEREYVPEPSPRNPAPHERLMALQSAALGGLISDDWFDDLKDTLSDLGAKGLGLIDKVKKEVEDRGATILTDTWYVGPGNRVDEAYQKAHPPKNIIDQTGLNHDLEYSDIAKRRDSGEITKEQADEEIRKSDEKFLKSVQANYKKDPWAALLGYAGIWSKTVAEDIGAIDRNAFVTAARGRRITRERFRR
jgi:hypothetical protein